MSQGILHLSTLKTAVIHFLSVLIAASGLLLKGFIPLFMIQPIKCQWGHSLDRCVTVVTSSLSHPRKSLPSGVQNGFLNQQEPPHMQKHGCVKGTKNLLLFSKQDSRAFILNHNLWTVEEKSMEIKRP